MQFQIRTGLFVKRCRETIFRAPESGAPDNPKWSTLHYLARSESAAQHRKQTIAAMLLHTARHHFSNHCRPTLLVGAQAEPPFTCIHIHLLYNFPVATSPRHFRNGQYWEHG